MVTVNTRAYKKIAGIFWEIFKTYPAKILVFWGCLVVASWTQVVSLGALYPILARMIGQDDSTNKIIIFFDKLLLMVNAPLTLTSYMLLFLSLGLFAAGVSVAVEIYQGRFLRQLETEAFNSLFERIIGVKYYILRKFDHGDLLTLFNRDINQKIKIILHALYMIGFATQVALYGAFAVYLNYPLFLSSICLFMINIIFFVPMLKKADHVGSRLAKTYVTLNNDLLNITRSFKQSKAASLESNLAKRMQRPFFNAADAFFKANVLSVVQAKLTEIVGFIILSTLFILGLNVFSVKIEVLVLMLVVFMKMIPAVRKVLDEYHRAVIHLPAASRVDSVKELCYDRTRLDGEILKEPVDEITFKNVSFGYISKQNIISQLSLEFKKGDFWMVTGQTGIGKTTLLDLISGIIEPIEGEISINGKKIETLQLKSLHDHIGYLTQHNFIFQGSLLENIVWGNEDVSLERVNQVVGLVQLRDLVDQKGLDYKILESGQNLSGGQKQRIALARTLLHDYDFILFDEPTSALDPATEAKILENLLKFKNKVGIIMVTHRSYQEEYFDYILDFQENCQITVRDQKLIKEI